MNLRELFSNYPLGCESFGGEWIRRWEAVGRLLEMPGRSWVRFPTGWFYLVNGMVGDLLAVTIRAQERRSHKGALGYRIALLDGTVVREWGEK